MRLAIAFSTALMRSRASSFKRLPSLDIQRAVTVERVRFVMKDGQVIRNDLASH